MKENLSMESLFLRLSGAQKHMLSLLSRKLGLSSSELIRQALDAYLVRFQHKPLDFKDALKLSAGSWKHRKEIKDSAAYVRQIRKEVTASFRRRSRYL